MFKKKNILVVGDIMLDKYSHGTVSRVSPEAPVPIVDIQKIHFSLNFLDCLFNHISEK